MSDDAGSGIDDFATLDLHRSARNGDPEVVFGEDKTPAQVAAIVGRMLAETDGPVFVTRATPEHAAAVPGRYDAVGRVVVCRAREMGSVAGTVAIATAGTTDLPVAREAATTLEALGVRHDLIPDIGVAGLHRAIEALPRLSAASVCVVVAGMDGALPSVLTGLLAIPVVAVPTSVGYGASFDGLAALLSMLSSCAPGLAVVNIDSGFGAAMHAVRILRARR